jgi:hypothetical protein
MHLSMCQLFSMVAANSSWLISQHYCHHLLPANQKELAITSILCAFCMLLQLLVSLQSSIAGELRSCLLDSLSQSSTSSTASMSMSEDELAAQLSTAIAAARKEGAAAAIEGLEEAIAAGKLAAWVVKAAVGVGALQLVKAGAGMALERVS